MGSTGIGFEREVRVGGRVVDIIAAWEEGGMGWEEEEEGQWGGLAVVVIS